MAVLKRAKAKQSSQAPKLLRLEDFRYFDQLGISLPQLALCIGVDGRLLSEDGDVRDYQFKPGRMWYKLAHQTAGHACHQRYSWISPLTPKTSTIAQSLSGLVKAYEDSQIGWFGVSLEMALVYRDQLKAFLGADCNLVYQDLEEGWLPIDLEFLPQLVADVLPKDLDDLIEWKSGYERSVGAVARWELVLIHENSD